VAIEQLQPAAIGQSPRDCGAGLYLHVADVIYTFAGYPEQFPAT
jgi:hypothetical protein